MKFSTIIYMMAIAAFVHKKIGTTRVKEEEFPYNVVIPDFIPVEDGEECDNYISKIDRGYWDAQAQESPEWERKVAALYQLDDLRRRREQELCMEQKRGESLMARKDALQKKREAYRGEF